ncbi:MAG: hypothetical protein FWE04_00790 [Oscillospiraceae bacterium]|nr:hypothetical protein [Oscillospiraceae bacterium]
MNKKASIGIAVVVVLVLVIIAVLVINNGDSGGADGSLDGTFAHGAEVITFDGENFVVSGGAGHRHLPNGEGTFSVTGNNIEFTFDDGNVETRRFSHDGNSITLDGHRYPRR